MSEQDTICVTSTYTIGFDNFVALPAGKSFEDIVSSDIVYDTLKLRFSDGTNAEIELVQDFDEPVSSSKRPTSFLITQGGKVHEGDSNLPEKPVEVFKPLEWKPYGNGGEVAYCTVTRRQYSFFPSQERQGEIALRGTSHNEFTYHASPEIAKAKAQSHRDTLIKSLFT